MAYFVWCDVTFTAGVAYAIVFALGPLLTAGCGPDPPRPPVFARGEEWGPLTVSSGPPSGNEALLTGNITITDDCVMLRTGGREEVLLVWPSEATTWDADTRAIHYTGGGDVSLQDGDRVSFGGGGWSRLESEGTEWAGSNWAGSTNWVAGPRAECLTDERWFVGYLARP